MLMQHFIFINLLTVLDSSSINIYKLKVKIKVVLAACATSESPGPFYPRCTCGRSSHTTCNYAIF